MVKSSHTFHTRSSYFQTLLLSYLRTQNFALDLRPTTISKRLVPTAQVSIK